MALIVLCAFPVFASTPEQDMVLIVDEDDGEFTGLQQVSDEQMAQVEGDVFHSVADGAGPLTKQDVIDLGWVTRISISLGYDGQKLIVQATNNCDGTYTVLVDIYGSAYEITGTQMGIESVLISYGFNATIVNKIMNKVKQLV